MEGNAWVLEKIRGILNEEEYQMTIENLRAIEKEFEKWGQDITSF
ncbi:hypothetical protein [Thermococcus henrietii]|nr:hypothetical protein [Thermococcus henrietii]